MSNQETLQQVFQKYRIFITAEHPCSYFDDRVAQTYFLDPDARISMDDYNTLLKLGFRRSGEHVYRPACPTCNQCISLRIPVNSFKPNRNQRRVLKNAHDVKLVRKKAIFDENHYLLYCKYMKSRHKGGGMDTDEPTDYARLVESSWANCELFELWLENKLLAVAVVDVLADALSAVYTFFDPDYSSLSPGTLSILKQIEECLHTGKRWLYLGYWIPDSPKMSYKQKFEPHEIFVAQGWQKHG